jgi:hypothetical protein
MTPPSPPNGSGWRRVVDDLIEAADDEYGVGLVTMLRGEDFQDALVDEAALPSTDPTGSLARSRTSSWTRLRN